MDSPNPQDAHAREHTEGPTFEAIHTNHNQRDNASVRTSIDDSTARNSPKPDEKGYGNASGVNIHRAEADFAELSKELSRTSNVSRRLSRVQSRQSRKDKTITDVEKAAAEDSQSDEPFDLEATLRGGRDEEERAGIKSKRIGVMWDGLTVSGIGTATLRKLHTRLILIVA